MCSLCSKRGIACTYKGVAADVAQEGEPATTASISQTTSSAHPAAAEEVDASTPAPSSPSPRLFGGSSGIGDHTTAGKDDVAKKCMQMVLECTESSTTPRALADNLESAPPEILEWATASYTTYVDQFHHHWPIIHTSTFDIERETNSITASVLSIGCWLQGHADCDDLVARIHQILISQFLNDLVRLSEPILAPTRIVYAL